MRALSRLVLTLSRSWLRSREAVFFALLFPIILLLIFSAVFAGGSAEFTLYVQNNDVGPAGEATTISAAFVDSLSKVEVLDVKRLSTDRNLTAWSRSSADSGTKRVVVVPDGFEDRVRTESLRVRTAVIRDTVNRSEGDLNDTQATAVRSGLTRAEAATNATGPVAVTFLAPPDDEAAPTVRGIVDSVVARFNQRAIGVDEPVATVEAGTLGERGVSATAYYLPAFIAAIILINGVMTVPAVVAGYRHDGTLKRLVATPLRKRDWILANVIHQSALALVLMVVMILVARLVFGVTATPGPLAVALVVLGAVAFTALGLVLGTLLHDPDAATSLGGAIAFPMMFLSGVFWEPDVMPPALQSLATVMPLYHFHRGLRRLMILETTDGVAVPFAVLGGMAVGFVALAVRVTRWRDFDG
jgi:ABC-2 type transport system permease protein